MNTNKINLMALDIMGKMLVKFRNINIKSGKIERSFGQ